MKRERGLWGWGWWVLIVLLLWIVDHFNIQMRTQGLFVLGCLVLGLLSCFIFLQWLEK